MATCLKCHCELPVGIRECPNCGPPRGRAGLVRDLPKLILIALGVIAILLVLATLFPDTRLT